MLMIFDIIVADLIKQILVHILSILCGRTAIIQTRSYLAVHLTPHPLISKRNIAGFKRYVGVPLARH